MCACGMDPRDRMACSRNVIHLKAAQRTNGRNSEKDLWFGHVRKKRLWPACLPPETSSVSVSQRKYSGLRHVRNLSGRDPLHTIPFPNPKKCNTCKPLTTHTHTNTHWTQKQTPNPYSSKAGRISLLPTSHRQLCIVTAPWSLWLLFWGQTVHSVWLNSGL